MLREVLLLVFVSVSSLTLSTVSRPPLLPKLRLAGCTDTWETTFPEPVPERATESGSRTFPAAPVLTASAPWIAAFAVGWNTTRIVQRWPSWRVAGQLLVCAYSPLVDIWLIEKLEF